MKKIIFIFVLILPFCISVASGSRFYENSKYDDLKGSLAGNSAYPKPTTQECYKDIDYCFDRYCFDKKELQDDIYSRCGSEPASKILTNVNDCLMTREIINELDLIDGCSDYTYNRVIYNLANKDDIELGLKQDSDECKKANKALQAAKKCYSVMISHTGEIDYDLYDDLDKLCGFEASGDSYMLNRFYHAGDYGKSNIGAIEDMKITGQNTVKRENWRQVVDATMVSYTELAELACGMEDYTLSRVNQFELDDRNNLAMVEAKEKAKEIGKQTATRIVDGWFAKDDCLKADVPNGGSRFTFDENKSPSCRLICKEGYNVSSNFKSCVKKQEEKETSQFLGLNLGGWIEQPVYTTPVVNNSGSYNQDFDYVPSYPSGGNQTINTPVVFEKANTSSVCSKDLQRQKWSPSKGKDGVCEVFFPNGKLRYYSRNTEKGLGKDKEFYCTGNSDSSFDTWYEMYLSELNDHFGTNYEKMGDGYKSYMSKVIKDYCLGDREVNSVDSIAQNAGTFNYQNEFEIPQSDLNTNSTYEKENTSYNISCSDIQSYPVDTNINTLNVWENFLKKNVSNCKNNFDNLEGYLKAYKKEIDDELKYGASYSEYSILTPATKSEMAAGNFINKIKEFQNCICKNEACQNVENLYSNGSHYGASEFSGYSSEYLSSWISFVALNSSYIKESYISSLEKAISNNSSSDYGVSKIAPKEINESMKEIKTDICN